MASRHRLLPGGEPGRGMAQLRADHGGGGSPDLHGASRWKIGEAAGVTKRSRAVAETAGPLRQGAGTGPDDRITVMAEFYRRPNLRLGALRWSPPQNG